MVINATQHRVVEIYEYNWEEHTLLYLDFVEPKHIRMLARIHVNIRTKHSRYKCGTEYSFLTLSIVKSLH